MKRIDAERLDAAERFVWLNGRLLDRLRFAHLFRGGPPDGVVAALRAYQNPDGGFGHAIEPDLRGPTSQPRGIGVAFEILDEADRMADAMVSPALDWAHRHSAPDGGLPFVLPTVRADPRAPWWETPDEPPGGLVPTGAIVGLMLKHRIDHPWVGPATEFCWRAVESLDQVGPYEARNAVAFLDQVLERDRAVAAARRIGRLVLEQAAVALDPTTEGEVHFPLDFAPSPDSLARSWFSDEVIETHLDALVDAQCADGGWTFNWSVWTPIVEPEWRGEQTVWSLSRLRAYGRGPTPP